MSERASESAPESNVLKGRLTTLFWGERTERKRSYIGRTEEERRTISFFFVENGSRAKNELE